MFPNEALLRTVLSGLFNVQGPVSGPTRFPQCWAKPKAIGHGHLTVGEDVGGGAWGGRDEAAICSMNIQTDQHAGWARELGKRSLGARKFAKGGVQGVGAG